MSNFSEEQVKHLMELSRISLSEEEIGHLLIKLKEIVGHISRLEGVDTDGVLPCIRVQQSLQLNPLRKDEIKDPLSRELFLKNAPKSVGSLVQVPVVIEKEGQNG